MDQDNLSGARSLDYKGQYSMRFNSSAIIALSTMRLKCPIRIMVVSAASARHGPD